MKRNNIIIIMIIGLYILIELFSHPSTYASGDGNSRETENVLMAVEEDNRGYMMSANYWEFYKIFRNDEISTTSIVSVTFLDTLADMPSDAWDVSAKSDGSVMAWITDANILIDDEPGYNFYIAGEGGVNANQDSSYLFRGYKNLQTIEFNHCFYTTGVKNMSHMFENVSVASLDLSDFDTSAVINMDRMFCGCSYLTYLNISGFDTSQVTNMSKMFSYCAGLDSVNWSVLDTSQVTDMSFMFYGSAVENVDLSGFDTSKVENMLGMFEECQTVEELDLSSFHTESVTCMDLMFSGCVSLKKINLSSFDTSNVTTMSNMFENCSNLESLNLGSFDTSNVKYMDYMFYNCSSLKNLNIAGFDMDQAQTYEMFTGAGVSGNTDILGAVLVFVCTWQFLLAAALALLAAVVIFIIIIRKRRAKQ